MESIEPAIGGDQVVYLYGVIPRGQSLPAGTGVPLQVVAHSESAAIAAVVEPVSAVEFAPETMEEKLKSLEWIGRLAHRHQAVLAEATRLGAVVPSRLCTLFSSTEALRSSLAANEEEFLAALERIEGREEWGLKLYCAEPRLRAALGEGDPQVQDFAAALTGASPGHAFVLGKKREARLAEIVAARIDDVIGETVDALEPGTADMRLIQALLPAVAGDSGVLVLNLALLAEVAGGETLHGVIAELAESLADEGFTFEVSGPWPPYNFCTGEEEG
jgi:Gas vesicle synthesis protein GvpL/GvpF